MAGARVRFKASDIWDAPDDEYRYEVIDGELFMSPAPGWGHQLRVGKLFLHLAAWVYRFNLGKIVPAPTGVALGDEDGVQPDIVFVSRERENLISARGVEGAPDLVVEALSPSTEARDRGIKMRRYAAAGVPHYWLLSSLGPALETYKLREHGYEQTGAYGPGDIFRPELFPGLEIPVDEIWT